MMVRDSYFNTLKGVLGKALPLRAVMAERTLQRVEMGA